MADESTMRRASSLLGCDDVSALMLGRTMKVPGAVYNIQLTQPQVRMVRP